MNVFMHLGQLLLWHMLAGNFGFCTSFFVMDCHRCGLGVAVIIGTVSRGYHCQGCNPHKARDKVYTGLFIMIQLIRRHIQSISLLMIAILLMVTAFIISQQTRRGDGQQALTVTPHVEVGSLSEVPDCTGIEARQDALACYSDAAQVSEALVLSEVEMLTLLETDASRRMEFLETQFTWEDSRDADCEFVRGAAIDAADGKVQELMCLTEHNLARFEQLEGYRCEWYQPGECEEETDTP